MLVGEDHSNSLHVRESENIMEKIIAAGHYGSNSGASE